jgi:hypothetical protein
MVAEGCKGIVKWLVCYTSGMTLMRLKSKPGSAVQRFGDWRKGEPQIIIDNQTWLEVGKPDKVEFSIPKKNVKQTI